MKKRFGKMILGLAIIGAMMSGMIISASAASADDFQGYDMSQEPSYRRLYYSTDDGISTQSATIDTSYIMPNASWNLVTSNVQTADIVVTKDCVSLGIDHGHAALMVSTERTVEHYGPKKLGLSGATGYSNEYDLENMWIHCKTCRVYRHDDLTAAQKNTIANYAKKNLIGWKYFLTASRYDENEMNCATLVWKAYDAAGITLRGYWDEIFYTMLPSDFVEQNWDLSMIVSINWTSGAHRWN